ncbi:MAG TPA: hypothetical protein VF126_02645 [Acidobacteriaceae bacterium]
MISYEAPLDAKVVVKDRHRSEGWNFGTDPQTHAAVEARELKLDLALFPDG